MLDLRNSRRPERHSANQHMGSSRPAYERNNPLKDPYPSNQGRFQEPDLSADLVIELPGRQVRRFKVYSPAVMIGRGQNSDIVLNYPAISRQHARLFQVNNDYWLMDMGSTNGTMVNGRYIESIRLSDGDVLTVGADGEEPIYITIYINRAAWGRGSAD